MSETQNSNTDKPVAPTRPGRSKKPLGLALIIALIALGLSCWQLYNTQFELASLRQDLSRHGAVEPSRQLVNQLQQTDAKVSSLEARLNENSSQLNQLSSVYQDMTKVRSDWLLTEVGHALTIANQELQLAGNVPAAISALQMINDRLQPFDRPELSGVKHAVAHDLAQLKALPYLDVIGLSARIDTLTQGVDSLPLRVNAERQAQATDARPPVSSGWGEAWRTLTDSFSDLVRIRRIDQPEAILLMPEQAFQLRENLKLHLLDARLSLLQRNPVPFNSDMRNLQNYVNRYFDLHAPATQQWLKMLAEIKAAPINSAVPDIAASLKAVNSSPAASGVKP